MYYETHVPPRNQKTFQFLGIFLIIYSWRSRDDLSRPQGKSMARSWTWTDMNLSEFYSSYRLALCLYHQPQEIRNEEIRHEIIIIQKCKTNWNHHLWETLWFSSVGTGAVWTDSWEWVTTRVVLRDRATALLQVCEIQEHVQVRSGSEQQIRSLNVAPSPSHELLVNTFAFLWIIHSPKWLGRWFMRMLLGLLGDLCLYKQPCWMCPIGAHAGLHEHLWHFPFLQAFK